MKRRQFISLIGAGVAGAALPAPVRALARGTGRSGEYWVERWSWAMGQPVHLQLFGTTQDHAYEAASAALAELRRVEARLSLFDGASDLSELNRRAGRGWWRADQDLISVLRSAERLQRQTDGAFNIAVEPLMRVWGFRRPRAAPPTPAELAEAEEAVRAAVIRIEGDRVQLPSSHTRIDFGGIGVGYGLDRAAVVLRKHRIRAALLDVSGDCIALGAPPGQSGWEVDIADSARPGVMLARTRLADAALATSSNQVSVVHYDGKSLGHIMDPESGAPASALRQATAVAGTGIGADALSTAMIVAGRAVGPATVWTYPVESAPPPGRVPARAAPGGSPSRPK
ncbi:MAG TPA: FAD:protein FMN transferase [Gemmatimonadales bacterium]|nr:FAD:protein FMN transferase [Gemmatimonadales bacterium]